MTQEPSPEAVETEFPCFDCGHQGIDQDTGECPLHGYWEACIGCGTHYEWPDAYKDGSWVPVCPACGWKEGAGFVTSLKGFVAAA